MEYQTQKFKVCPKCSGLNTIKSDCDRGMSIFAVTIPRDACSLCLDEGYKFYKNVDIQNYSNAYLQDRVNDIFLKK